MSAEDELLDNLRLHGELALERAARLVEFMRAVFENEAQLLRISNPEVIMRVLPENRTARRSLGAAVN